MEHPQVPHWQYVDTSWLGSHDGHLFGFGPFASTPFAVSLIPNYVDGEWDMIDDANAVVWAPVNDAQSVVWTAIDDANTPSWTEINTDAPTVWDDIPQ